MNNFCKTNIVCTFVCITTNKAMKIKTRFFFYSLPFLLISCDFVKQAYNETFGKETNETTTETHSETTKTEKNPETSSTASKEVNLLESPSELTKIQQELKAMFPGKTLKIYPPHIYFEEQRVRLQLINPDNTNEIDWYYYQAKTASWQKEDPVKLSTHFERNPILLDEIDFSMANNFYQQINTKAASVEGAKPITTVYFTFNLPQWNWNARIYGSRADYDFKTDKNGKEIEFEQQ